MKTPARVACLTWLLALIFVVTAGGVGAEQATEPRVEAANLLATVAVGEHGGTATVRLTYRLTPAGRTEIPLRASAVAGAGIDEDVRVLPEELGPVIRLEQTAPGRYEGTLEIPSELAGQEVVELTLAYAIERPVDSMSMSMSTSARTSRDLTIPVLAVPWPTPRAAPEAFRATLELSGWDEVFRSFPRGWKRVAETEPERAAVYETALPVVPAMLRFSVARDRPPWWTVERLSDLSILAILGGLAVVGWRRFRGLLT